MRDSIPRNCQERETSTLMHREGDELKQQRWGTLLLRGRGRLVLEFTGVGDVDDEEVPNGAVHILHGDGGLYGEILRHLHSHFGATVQPFDFRILVVLGFHVVHSVDLRGLVVLVQEDNTAAESVLRGLVDYADHVVLVLITFYGERFEVLCGGANTSAQE